MTKPAQVYPLAEAEPGTYGVIRYSGDPDEFTALAHAWMLTQGARYFDVPMGLVAPEPKLYRMNPDPGGEFSWLLGEARQPGHGVWIGALLKLKQIGCSECFQVGGRHLEACLNEGITGLVTLQFQGHRQRAGMPHSEFTVHAVRSRGTRPGRLGGTPGPTLCGLPRFDPDTPGWSVGGGVMGGDMDDKFRRCYMCARVAKTEFPGLAISGSLPLARAFAGDGVPLADHLVRALTAKTNARVPATVVARLRDEPTDAEFAAAGRAWDRLNAVGR